jgi:hypothetical protein
MHAVGSVAHRRGACRAALSARPCQRRLCQHTPCRRRLAHLHVRRTSCSRAAAVDRHCVGCRVRRCATRIRRACRAGARRWRGVACSRRYAGLRRLRLAVLIWQVWRFVVVLAL